MDFGFISIAQAQQTVPAEPGNPVADPEIVGGGIAGVEADLSLLGLFLQASPFVQLVMVGLVFASIFCWAIIAEKFIVIRKMRSAIKNFDNLFWAGHSLDDLYVNLGPKKHNGTSSLFMAAMREWKRSQESAARAGFAGVQLRIDKVMDVQMQREVANLESRLLVLATVGSSGPFIGLLGTVVGIVNSFQSIAVSNSTSLAVVAPGIAEALFATALGLVAAIPAVMFYNKFTNDISKITMQLENFADEFSAIISRQLDESY